MAPNFVSEDDVEKALHYLRETAFQVAKAKADLHLLESSRKRQLSLIMKEHLDLPVSAQEREAWADERMTLHLKAERDAMLIYEKLKHGRDAAEMVIEAWRSQSANERAMKL